MTDAKPTWYRNLRRQDRGLSHEEALEVVDGASYGVLAMAWPDGRPYCVPINHGRDEDIVYMHCGKSGQKLDLLRLNPLAVLCVTEAGPVVTGETPCEASITFRSALVFGRVRELNDPAEKIAGLISLCRILGLEIPAQGTPGYDAFVNRATDTVVLALEIEHISGKARA